MIFNILLYNSSCFETFFSIRDFLIFEFFKIIKVLFGMTFQDPRALLKPSTRKHH